MMVSSRKSKVKQLEALRNLQGTLSDYWVKSQRMRVAFQVLREAGFLYPEIAQLSGYSKQRVEQVCKEKRRSYE